MRLSEQEYQNLIKGRPIAQDAPKKAKYGNTKVEVDGHKFDSKKEAQYYHELMLRKKAGEIRDIVLQWQFNFYIDNDKMFSYYADFCFFDIKQNKEMIIDVKGVKTPVYRLKKKLIERYCGITITEI